MIGIDMFLLALFSATSLSVGVCILMHRPDHAPALTKAEALLVIVFWWLILAVVQCKNLKERMGW